MQAFLSSPLPSQTPQPLPTRPPPRTRTRWRCVLPTRLSELSNALSKAPSQKARYVALLDLGQTLTPLSAPLQTTATRVRGCTSITHIEATLSNSQTISLRGSSDALLTRGLVAFLVQGLSNLPASAILSITAREILEASSLLGTLTPSRVTGLTALLAHVQAAVKGLQTVREPAVSAASPSEAIANATQPRWSDVQGADVAVLLSGGVDSSVALRRVQEAGMNPHAFYLKIWLEDELAHLGKCPWEEDMEYATAVCKQAGVPLTDLPFQRAYWNNVVEYTVSEARAGRTPNPDVMCNTRVKFGAFLDGVGGAFEQVVTGHYARSSICERTGKTELRLSGDVVKDQTYFLAHLRQEQVKRARFPLGDFSKAEVRILADRYDLPNKNRRDSQGICFLGKLKFDDFLGHHLGHQSGQLVEFESGRELGKHGGFWFFTIGQRRGIGLSGGPWYVVCKDIERNIVYVSRDYDRANMLRNWFQFESPMWIAGEWPEMLALDGAKALLLVKTRHGPSFHKAVVTRLSKASGRVDLHEKDKGLAPGQFAAFYDHEGRCLGSGVISSDVALEDAPQIVRAMDKYSIRLQAHVS